MDGTNAHEFNDHLMKSYELREKLVSDPLRPTYHFLPPEGRWNDINGAVYWNGRYHIGYLQKISHDPDKVEADPRTGRVWDFSSWQHVSSRDLLHWRYHKASIREDFPGYKGAYFNSGDVMDFMDIPTIILNDPRRGICIYQSHDENLDEWVPLPENPVIPINSENTTNNLLQGSRGWNKDFPEVVIFDPSGWKEGDTYYALIGNKNFRPGFEGDTVSLFKSADLKDWQYVGPFYKSDRKWTSEEEDCACSNFFPFGEKHMMVMHTHKPFAKSQYYIGTYKDEQFYPEIHGQLSWFGSLLAGPETLLDDNGRRIYWGWLADARSIPQTFKGPRENSAYPEGWETIGWSSVMTLPRHFDIGPNNTLLIKPVEELKNLRYDHRDCGNITLDTGQEQIIDGIFSDCMEINLSFKANKSSAFGVKLLHSDVSGEETIVTYDRSQSAFIIDFSKASLNENLNYRESPINTTNASVNTGESGPWQHGYRKQFIPYQLPEDSDLSMEIFIDKSILEIFVNSEICLTQRIYPTHVDSKHFSLFTNDAPVEVENIQKWEIDATNPW